MKYNIALVDDNVKLLNQLAIELSGFADLNIVIKARNGEDYLEQMKALPPARRPHAVIMDIEMPVMNGIEAVKRSSALYEDIQYLMFTVADDDDNLFEALKAGAHGYLLKEELVVTIVAALVEIIEKKGAPTSPGIARKILKMLVKQPEQADSADVTGTNLSDREIEILKGMVAGLSYKQLAEKLFLSPFTIRNHISKIYTKLHITSKAQAIKLAVKNRWV